MAATDTLFLGTAEYHRKFYKICKPIIDFLDLTGVALIHFKNQHALINIHTSVPWMERCMEKHYYLNDPNMVSPDNMASGFAFDASYRNKEFQTGMLKDAENNFDLCYSFSYIEKGKNSYQELAFATSFENHTFTSKVLSNFRIIKRFIRHIQEELNNRQNQIEKYAFDFSILKGDLFYEQPGLISPNSGIPDKQLEALKKLGIIQPIGNIDLSAQERRCLRLYLDNGSTKEVADSLDLSQATVASYLQNTKNKLGCSYKNDLLKIAEALEGIQKL